MRYTSLVITAMLSLTALSCKPENSETKSVDALLSGSVNEPISQACGEEDPSDKDVAAHKKVLKEVFIRLPTEIQTFYGGLANAKNSVDFYPDAEIGAKCEEALKGESAKTIERAKVARMCVGKGLKKVEGGNASIPRLMMAEDANLVRGNFLSFATFVFLGYYVDDVMKSGVALAEDQGSFSGLKSHIAEFVQLREKFTANVLRDMEDQVNAKGESLLNAFATEFEVKADALESSKVFQNFVVSEFAESFYCSIQSLDYLETKPFANSDKKWSDETRAQWRKMFSYEFLGAQQPLKSTKL